MKTKNEDPSFFNRWDIHSQDCQIFYDCLIKYKEYNQNFIIEKGIINNQQDSYEEPFSGPTIFKDLYILNENLIIKYLTQDFFYDDSDFIDFIIISVADCAGPHSFEKLVTCYADEGFETLLQLISNNIGIKESILMSIISDLSSLKQNVENPTTDVNKKFSNARFCGSIDESILFDTGAKNRIQSKIQGYIGVWLNVLESLILKTETYKNYWAFATFNSTNNSQIKSTPAHVDITNIQIAVVGFKYKYFDTQPDLIRKLMNALIAKNYIKPCTPLPVFKKVFSGNEISNPIIWIGKKGELAYLIKYIHRTLKLFEDSKISYWETCTHCFKLQGNISISYNQLHDAKRPAQYLEIEAIAQMLK